MRTRNVLLTLLGLTACIGWAFGSASADQPGGVKSGAGAQLAPAASAATPANQTTDKPAEPANRARPDAQAPVSVSPGGNSSPDGVQYPAGYQAPEGERIGVDPATVLPVSPNASHYAVYVDTETGESQGGPRDVAGVCLPAGGVCGPIVYKNTVQEYFRYYTTQNTPVLEDIYLDGTERDICSITTQTYGIGTTGTYTIALELWTGCPLTLGSQKLGGPYTSPALPAQTTLSTTTFALPGVHVPSFFWLQSTYTCQAGVTAGPLLTELAEIGFTGDVFGKIEGNPQVCNLNYYYGGGPIANPWTGFGYEISAAGLAVGKCCYNNCATCADTTYGNCMARAGNPEFLLGSTCAEAPACGKGACCLTTGVCVANKTQIECQNTANYLSWQLGADCTAHGVVPAADCAGIPTNDLCANAISLNGTCVTVAYNSRSATYTAIVDDPPICLQDPADPNNNVAVTNDIWYLYAIPSTYNGTPVTSAKVVINTLGSKYDTFLAAYATNFSASPANACGNNGAVTCADVSNTNIVGCNDDIVGLSTTTYDPLHGQIQASLVTVTCDGSSGPLPGGCLLIRVAGLDQAGNTSGGAGVLNIDFIPTGPQPTFYSSNGVCCLPNGTCVMKNSAPDCTALLGFYRPTTDFYENGNPAAGFEASAPGCCHGEFGSCQVGEFCGKPIVINPGVYSWAGSVHRVTYFKFTARDFRAGDPGYPGADPHYALTIDTCGSAFDTVLSVYKGPFSSFPFTDAGDCDDPGAVIARNDDCSLDTPGADGRVACATLTATISCVCLSVGSDETNYNLMAGNEYYIAVGMKDARLSPQRAMGIDPVPNYPVASAVALSLHIADGWENCSACTKQCCKGDMDGNGTLDALDIAGFVNVLCAATPLSCQDATWCRANMNGDSLVDLGDIGTFVSALLVPWACDHTPYCSVDGYCQSPNQAGGVVSDTNTTIANKTADNFVSYDGGQLTRVCWWGFNAFRAGTTWGTCTVAIPADNFAIRFYSNFENRPGAVLASYSGITLGAAPYNLTKVATGNTIIGASEYKYEVQIPPVAIQPDTCVWMEIVNNTGSADCWWLWETGNGGDSRAAQWQYGYYRQVTNTATAFCVNIPIRAQGCVQYCEVPCPAGGIAEGEPDCGPGYVDNYNAGCNMAVGTEVFTNILAGQTICGESGIFDSATPGFVERDTDWYKLVLTGTLEQHVTIVVNAEFSALTGLMQYAQNTGSGNCADLSGYISPYATGRCTPLVVDAWLIPGTYYIFVAPDFNDPFYPTCGAKYTVGVTVVPCGTYTACLATLPAAEKCPGGTGHTAEPETCGQNVNNGCNQTPAAFGSIACGGKICGTSWAQGGSRDTDWYQFTLTTAKQVKATLSSEFPGTVRILKVDSCIPLVTTTLATAYSAGCVGSTAIANLDAGTYVVWVAPGNISGPIYNCVLCTDPWTHYDLHLVCDPPVVCTAPTYWQDYHNSPSIIASDKPLTTQYKGADNFKPTVSGNITHVCWWGANAIYSGGYSPCTLATSNFNISFHLDNAGLPVTAAFSTKAVGTVVGQATGDSWTSSSGYVYPIYLYQTDITAQAVTAGTKYWISIWNGGAGNSCSFMWAANPDDVGGDDTAAQHTGTAWGRIFYDLAFGINIACDPNVFGNGGAYDVCTGAIDITANINGAAVAGDNTWAKQESTDLPFSCYTAGTPPTAQKVRKTVWYKFTAPANGSITIDTCSSTTPFQDSLLALYSGTCAAPVEVGCNDGVNGDVCGGASYYSKLIKTGLTPGVTYYLELGISRRTLTPAVNPGPFTLTVVSP